MLSNPFTPKTPYDYTSSEPNKYFPKSKSSFTVPYSLMKN